MQSKYLILLLFAYFLLFQVDGKRIPKLRRKAGYRPNGYVPSHVQMGTRVGSVGALSAAAVAQPAPVPPSDTFRRTMETIEYANIGMEFANNGKEFVENFMLANIEAKGTGFGVAFKWSKDSCLDGGWKTSKKARTLTLNSCGGEEENSWIYQNGQIKLANGGYCLECENAVADCTIRVVKCEADLQGQKFDVQLSFVNSKANSSIIRENGLRIKIQSLLHVGKCLSKSIF